jgi:hypothetical protein
MALSAVMRADEFSQPDKVSVDAGPGSTSVELDFIYAIRMKQSQRPDCDRNGVFLGYTRLAVPLAIYLVGILRKILSGRGLVSQKLASDRLVALNFAVSNVDNAVRMHGDVLLMCNQDDSVAFFVEPLEKRHDFSAGG